MPDIEPYGYIIELLYEIGPYKTGFNGPEPIGWTDIESWDNLTKYGLKPWEARTIRSLSVQMTNTMSQASDPHMPAPYTEYTVNAAEEHGKKVGAAFSAFAKVLSAGKKGR